MWNGPPALLHSLAHENAVAPEDLATLDEVWSGGGDCPEPVRAAFEAKFAKPALSTYGLSEAPTVVSIDDPDGSHVPGGSGRPLPHLAIHVVDDEICVAPHADGRVGGGVPPMLGYWQRDDATAETLRDGLLHTGDLGFVDDDGFLHIRDRKSLLIIRGGGNVYPAEIERVLHERPEIEACAVVGMPDERLGERVAVAVQLATAPPSARTNCASTAWPTWPSTRCPSAGSSSTTSPATPWARSNAATSPPCSCEQDQVRAGACLRKRNAHVSSASGAPTTSGRNPRTNSRTRSTPASVAASSSASLLNTQLKYSVSKR